MQLRFTSFAVTSLWRDLHPQECAHAGRTEQSPRAAHRRAGADSSRRFIPLLAAGAERRPPHATRYRYFFAARAVSARIFSTRST